MSEEVTYADLKFEDSSKTEHIQEFHKCGIKEPPAPSHIWRRRALALILLCLLLLIGLGVLGGIFYITSKTDMGELNKLQEFKEELQRNVSLQLKHNMDSFEKVRNLSITLQETATKLCHELHRKNPEHKCKPCPKEWMWHDDSCYLRVESYETWQKSDAICSNHNASLLRIKNKSVLEFIKSKRLYRYWLGLSPRKGNPNTKQLDTAIISSDWYTRNTNGLNDKLNCGYLHHSNVYYTSCTETQRIICEKLANSVKIESVLTTEVPGGRT
ncbi:C-type lectin domain family 12 member A [Camelus ferus]|uniref:C-type lectin domain family 12 member A n=2 Tax=Camelus TaxID=9836 RepID=A0A8B7KGX0_CAMFR|nr:C-type lectin domain family 12 member A [Camelus ferus]XP_032329003.1 C-type lectin domain family 12 member A [Camelus ferus]